MLHALLHESLQNLPTLGERSSVLSALETIIITLSSVASDLLRSEYAPAPAQVCRKRTQDDTAAPDISLPSPEAASTDAPPNEPQAQVDQSCKPSAPTLPTQDNQEQTPTQSDNTTGLDDLFESLAQTFMQYTPLLYTHTPLIPLPDPTDLSNTGGFPGPGWGPGAWDGRVWAEPRKIYHRLARNALNDFSVRHYTPLTDTEMYTQRTQEESPQSQDTEMCTPRTHEESLQYQDSTTSVTSQEVVDHTPQEPSSNVLVPYRRWTRAYTRVPHSHTAFHCAYIQLLSCIHRVVSLCIAITSIAHITFVFPPVICSYVYTQLLTTPGSESLVRGRITS